MKTGAATAQLAAAAAALLIVWGLKQHYSDARADDLLWILTPTARLAGAMTGSPFTLQPGEGYLSRERLFLIEKSCAGVNFMLAAFGMLVFTLFHRVRSVVSGSSVLGVSILVGFTAAVVVNAVRIAMAMWLSAHPVALSISSVGSGIYPTVETAQSVPGLGCAVERVPDTWTHAGART